MSFVSVVITSYNSSEYIIEALESVFNQTFNNIELIITDDCSKDDTVELCCNWLANNKSRFVNTKLITSKINTGVSANANRGLYSARGSWIKFLSADDTLKPSCLEDNILWVTNFPKINILFSRIEIYLNTFEAKNLLRITPTIPIEASSILFHNRSANSQYKMLLVSDRVHFTPSAFIYRETLLSIGCFDEGFRLIEDYPLWLKLTRNGHKLFFMEKTTVNYRMHLKAINNTGINYLINPNYFKQEGLRRFYTYPYLPIDIRLNKRFIWLVSYPFRWSWLNQNKRISRLIYLVLTKYLNPIMFFILIKKCLFKKLKEDEFYI